MNRAQQTIIALGLLVIAGFCLRPPYQWKHTAHLIARKPGVPHRVQTLMENIGHYWIWRPPAGWDETPYPMVRKSRVAIVDWPRLGVYVGLTATVALFGAFVAFNNKFSKKYRWFHRNLR